jgi:sugar phosphate isomerase/epimerase
MAFNPNIVCAYLYNITKHGYPPPASETVSYLKDMHRLGFSSVELEGIRQHHIEEMYHLRFEIKEALQDLQMQVPIYCTVLPNLSTLDPKIRKEQLSLFELGCQTANVLGAKIILDNGPLPPYSFPADIPVTRHYEHDLLSTAIIEKNFSWQNFWDNLVSTLQEVCDIAARYDLTYLVHPAFGVLGATPEAFLFMSGQVNRKNFGYNFDTSNLIALKCNLSLALHQLMPHTRYIHVSDNRGIKNEHIDLGKGLINWDQFFTTLKDLDYHGPIGIDIGGDESEVSNLDEAYRAAALLITRKMYSS